MVITLKAIKRAYEQGRADATAGIDYYPQGTRGYDIASQMAYEYSRGYASIRTNSAVAGVIRRYETGYVRPQRGAAK